ncbi:hypothetical protein SAMN04487925_1011696 [Bradyrhizobium sp. cf659]|nr:hypothetical protein SAMN04487925_1011696 [Bradyrhizobium sp. cf659]
MVQDSFVKARRAPSPRLRGEGWGEGESLRGRRQLDSRRLPLTRACGATSPRKRGEVKKTTEA